jgi:hypothetical protein
MPETITREAFTNERAFFLDWWPVEPSVQESPPPPDPEAVRERCLPLIKQWYGESDKYYELGSCHKQGMTYECPHGEKHRFPRACALTSCPIHGPRKLKRSWKKKLRHLPGPLVLAEWRPSETDASDSFSAIRKAAEKWRRKRITSGVHWVRYERKGDTLSALMLFVLPEYEPTDGLTVISDGATNDAALRWLQRHYLAELTLAETAEELATILEAQHRLQPFGADSKKWKERGEEYDQDLHGESTAQADVEFLHLENSTDPLGVETQRPAPPRKPVMCPIHHVEMKYTGIIGPMSEYRYVPEYDCWVDREIPYDPGALSLLPGD